ncbi:MAG: sporulation integral rane protein YtvI [Bacillota bacterium]
MRKINININYWAGVLLRLFLVAVICLAFIGVWYFVVPLIYPFIIAAIIAILLEPVVRFVQKTLRTSRGVSLFISLAVVLSSLLISCFLIIIELIEELIKFSQDLPNLLQYGADFCSSIFLTSGIGELFTHIQNYLAENPFVNRQVSDNLEWFVRVGKTLIIGLVSNLLIFVTDLPRLIMLFFLIVLSTFFISVDWPKAKDKIGLRCSVKINQTCSAVFADIRRAFLGYVRAQVILVIITGIVSLIAFLVLGIPYAGVLALIACLVDLLPYVGVGILFIPWASYLFFDGNNYWGFGLLASYILIILIRQLVEPKLMAKHVGITPLAFLIAIFVGVKLFGLGGIIIGPIVMVLITSLYRVHVFRDIYCFIIGDTKK